MVAKQNDKNKLINEAINESIKFEELMDKTDFDSWFDDDDPDVLKKEEQAITPFNKYKTNKKTLERICCKMVKKGSDVPPENGDKSSAEKYIIYNLFRSKYKRFEARKCFKKEAEKEKYETAIYHLLSALTVFQKPKVVNADKKKPKVVNADKEWEILLYNDLSICYAGLENSSMSRGYAEESKNIMEDETSFKYKEFFQKVNADTPTISKDIKNYIFFSSRLYDLYTIALYNQAVAQGRSYYYHDAEKNFMRIIKYAEKKKKKGDTPLRNFNYYSTLLKLSDLYIDLGRGEESTNLLNKIEKDENDIRYWNACIVKINALIDQSKYDDARIELYKNIFKSGNDFTPIKRHRITSTGFKGLNCFMRCIIENARNDLKRNDKKEEALKQAIAILKRDIKKMQTRKQEGLKTKAYKQLSDIYKIFSRDKDISKYNASIIKYLTLFISKDKIKNLNAFISDPRKDGWIEKCDDLDALESFTNQVITKVQQQDEKITPELETKDQRQDNAVNKHGKYNENKLRYIVLLEKLEEKITKECEDKDQLSRAERIVRKINEAKKEKEYKEFIGFLDNIPYEEEKENNNFKDICKRLDINEKEFDKVLFKRSEINENHIAEVIILRRWNSFSPGLFRESKGSLGGGYLLRIKRNSYLFSFSNIMKEEGKQKFVKYLHTLDYADLVKNIEDAKYNKEGSQIRISRNNHRIATLKIKDKLCYLEWQALELEIGRVKEEDNMLNIYSNDDVENIVIDPGYNFLQNLRREGFYINDIDTIIVTHSHLDHCAELLSIMDLIYQFNKRYKDTPNEKRSRKKVNLCLSKGAYKKFSNYIDDPDWKKQLKDVIILENLKEVKCDSFNGLTISAIPTPHMDLGGVNAIGLKIKIGKKHCLGFIGDTPWDTKIKKAFKGCDFLCVHMGSIKYEEIGYTDDRYNLVKKEKRRITKKEQFFEELKKTYLKANHLLFYGTLDFIEHCSVKDEPLIIVGEFGEELKYGLRTDLCSKLRDEANYNKEEEKKIVCLPGDIGLYVGIEKDGTKKMRCNFCEEFVGQKEIETFTYGREDAIHYICKTCDNTLTNLQKQAVIKHRVTRH